MLWAPADKLTVLVLTIAYMLLAGWTVTCVLSWRCAQTFFDFTADGNPSNPDEPLPLGPAPGRVTFGAVSSEY